MVRGTSQLSHRGAFALALVLVSSCLIWPAHAERSTSMLPSARASHPDLVLILTDDQRWDTLWAMPQVQSLLVQHGVTFTNAFVVNSLCCPSRASILTGRYSHSTGVYGNSGTYGGFHSFKDRWTIATRLQRAGYRTALFGKYLNEYDSLYVPPGWSRWAAFTNAPSGGAYYDYDLNVGGTRVHFGHAPTDYSTDVLASYADSFIRGTRPDQPLFLYLSLKAPHVPTTPAPKYDGAFDGLEPYRPPNYNESDVSDKPRWVRHLQLWTPEREKSIDELREDQYETLLSVDDAVQTIVAALTDTGRLSNTMIVFMSDNGWSLGEHRWGNKKVAYEESIRVPMIVRYDPLTGTPRTDDHQVLNIDLAPTFGDVSGLNFAGDGVSLLPVIASPDPGAWRTDFLIEHLSDGLQVDDSPINVPTYCAVRSEGFVYVVYETGEEELYDLTLDPFELQNVATDPGYASVLQTMRDRNAVLCDPPPPGWPGRLRLRAIP
jgi:N-acetylglucosamine-6-sulfatase